MLITSPKSLLHMRDDQPITIMQVLSQLGYIGYATSD